MNPTLRFDTIHIIESLAVGRTGYRLFEDVEPMGIRCQPSAMVHFWPVSTKAQFIATLVEIARDAVENGHWPILHIEAHGGRDGIETSSGEFVPWHDFKWELVAINQAGRLNLLVVLAACEGVYLLQSMRPVERAPFATLIGPNRRVTDGEIERGCVAFYTGLFSSRDVGAALQAMNDAVVADKPAFSFVTAGRSFRLVFREFFSTQFTDEALARREREILKRVDETQMSHFVRMIKRGQLRTVLRDHRRTFSTFKKHFFFCDLFPENADRFGITLEECLAVEEMERR